MNAMPSSADDARSVPPYVALAAGYDVVMEHVDYETWADYVHALLQEHAPDAGRVLELGCGTGSFALALQPLGPYEYLATDGAAPMVRVAEAKADLEDAAVQFAVADFTDFRVDAPVDAVLLLYDGLNYLLEPRLVRRMMDRAFAALRPGGVFVFDQSTPANSENNEDYFGDEGEAEGFAYVRASRYDRETKLHTTTFELSVLGRTFREEHVQRAYDRHEVRRLAEAAGFVVEAAYDGFDDAPATDASERIHWVARRPDPSTPPPTDPAA